MGMNNQNKSIRREGKGSHEIILILHVCHEDKCERTGYIERTYNNLEVWRKGELITPKPNLGSKPETLLQHLVNIVSQGKTFKLDRSEKQNEFSVFEQTGIFNMDTFKTLQLCQSRQSQ